MKRLLEEKHRVETELALLREEQRKLELKNKKESVPLFKAKPAPVNTEHTQSLMEQFKQQEQERQERVKKRAEMLLKDASLPPRMAISNNHERKKESNNSEDVALVKKVESLKEENK